MENGIRHTMRQWRKPRISFETKTKRPVSISKILVHLLSPIHACGMPPSFPFVPNHFHAIVRARAMLVLLHILIFPLCVARTSLTVGSLLRLWRVFFAHLLSLWLSVCKRMQVNVCVALGGCNCINESTQCHFRDSLQQRTICIPHTVPVSFREEKLHSVPYFHASSEIVFVCIIFCYTHTHWYRTHSLALFCSVWAMSYWFCHRISRFVIDFSFVFSRSRQSFPTSKAKRSVLHQCSVMNIIEQTGFWFPVCFFFSSSFFFHWMKENLEEINSWENFNNNYRNRRGKIETEPRVNSERIKWTKHCECVSTQLKCEQISDDDNLHLSKCVSLILYINQTHSLSYRSYRTQICAT